MRTQKMREKACRKHVRNMLLYLLFLSIYFKAMKVSQAHVWWRWRRKYIKKKGIFFGTFIIFFGKWVADKVIFFSETYFGHIFHLCLWSKNIYKQSHKLCHVFGRKESFLGPPF